MSGRLWRMTFDMLNGNFTCYVLLRCLAMKMTALHSKVPTVDSLPRCLTASLPHCLTASLPRCLPLHALCYPIPLNE